MILSTLVDYKRDHLIEAGKQKLGLRVSILFNLFTLGTFKHFNFAKDNLASLVKSFGYDTESLSGVAEITLPIGISFYVF